MNCVTAIQPSINYFRDVDAAVEAFLSRQSYVPPIILKYCK